MRSRSTQLLTRLARQLADVVAFTFTTLRAYLRLDVPIVVFAIVFLVLYGPLVARNTENPQLLAAYVNDEPWLTMGLEAMLVEPYGNPGRYFDPLDPASRDLPDHWAEMRYPNITYYGGAMFELAFPFYAVSRAVGLRPFPTGPIILRTLTLLAGLLALVVLYNIAKDRGYRLAGLFAAAWMASDVSFIYYANYIHPDTLQMLFGLCAFILAVKHSRDGGRTSLLALGLFCGIIQGTKSGGVWTIPMALLALWLGARTEASWRTWRFGRLLGSRVALLGVAAVAGFFITTPYAFVESYYRRAMRIAYGAVTQNSLQLDEISLLTWGEALYHYIGPLGVSLFVLTVARTFWVNRSGVTDPALLLAVVLALSQFLWYGGAGRLWHVPGYLILSFGLLAALSFETLLIGVRKLLDRARDLPRFSPRLEKMGWVLAVLVIATILASDRWYVPVRWAVDQHAVTRSTVRAANEWAIEHGVRSDAAIVFDDLAYFDRERFPNARLHGGVLTWGAVDGRDPDYILLSESLFGAEWMQNLIAKQRLAPRDPEPFNVHLYQDLLPTRTPGPTKIPGISLAGVVRPAERKISEQHSIVAGFADVCDRTCNLGIVDVGAELGRFADLERRLRALAQPGDEPLIGPELRIYRLG